MVRVLFVEPPKDYWFVMGEYLPPPYGLLQLAGYLESKLPYVEIEVLDCQAMTLDWNSLAKRIETFNPDIVASSGFATCNVYLTARTLELAKKLKPEALTVTGGQHFTALAHESLETCPEIDVIVRGEGEETFEELVQAVREKMGFSRVSSISFRHREKIYHNPPCPLIEDLNQLPFPAYHFVEEYVHRYHFTIMAGSKARYGVVEASRGCPHRCTFCSQWRHWHGVWRHKSVKRVADEMEFLYSNYGTTYLATISPAAIYCLTCYNAQGFTEFKPNAYECGFVYWACPSGTSIAAPFACADIAIGTYSPNGGEYTEGYEFLLDVIALCHEYPVSPTESSQQGDVLDTHTLWHRQAVSP